MSRVSGCLWLAVGLILALVAGGMVFVTLQRATATQAQAGPAVTRSVVVAARPLEAGTLLAEADLTMQSYPAETLPGGVIASMADATGQITTIPLNIGEMILAHHLARPDITAGNLGFTLPAGQVAVTLAADDLLSRAQLVQPGSRVDILYSLEIEAAADGGDSKAGSPQRRQYTFGTLQGVTVVSVLRSGAADKSGSSAGSPLGGAGGAALAAPYAYILALDSQDALALKYLRDAGAIMDLALRNVADDAEYETRPVDLRYLIDRYQLPVR